MAIVPVTVVYSLSIRLNVLACKLNVKDGLTILKDSREISMSELSRGLTLWAFLFLVMPLSKI